MQEKNERDESVNRESSQDYMEIVQLLDSDAPIEEVFQHLLEVLVGHLQVDRGWIWQTGNKIEKREVLAARNLKDWNMADWADPWGEGQTPENLIPDTGLLLADSPVVYDQDSIGMMALTRQLQPIGIRAIMTFPIIRQEQSCMYLCLLQIRESRRWETEEIKFAVDAVKILQSILTRRIQQHSLAGSYEVLQSIMNNVGCEIYVRDAVTHQKLFAGKSLKETFREELQNGDFERLLDSYVSENSEKGFTELCNEKTGRWYDLRHTRMDWVDGRPAVLYSLYDITDKKIYQKKIEQQAFRDFLTGLYNRLCCERDLEQLIEETRQEHTKGALLYMDLDNFKQVNDTQGHQYGDLLLQSIAGALQSIAGIHDHCYRLGGDEFVVIVPPGLMTEYDRILKDIQKVFASPWALRDGDYYCTVSLGAAIFPDAGEEVQALIRKADTAMYSAKKDGKNRMSTYREP